MFFSLSQQSKQCNIHRPFPFLHKKSIFRCPLQIKHLGFPSPSSNHWHLTFWDIFIICSFNHCSVKVMILNTKWHGCASIKSSPVSVFKPRKKVVGALKAVKSEIESATKKARLSAVKKERMKLPDYGKGHGNEKLLIGEFMSHPSAIEALLNTNALKSFQCLATNTYRCKLERIELLSFEVAPVLDLRVTPTDEDCTVEMLSCKFEGSEIMEQQNTHFSAFMRNHMTWDTYNSDPFLEVDVTLNLTLEIYTLPFTMLPVSAVEGPGNLMLQALLDGVVPLLLRQLMQDYEKWVRIRRLDSIQTLT